MGDIHYAPRWHGLLTLTIAAAKQVAGDRIRRGDIERVDAAHRELVVSELVFAFPGRSDLSTYGDGRLTVTVTGAASPTRTP